MDTIEKVKATKLELIQKRMKLTSQMRQLKGQIARLQAQGQALANETNAVIGQLELCDSLLESAGVADGAKPEPAAPAPDGAGA